MEVVVPLYETEMALQNSLLRQDDDVTVDPVTGATMRAVAPATYGLDQNVARGAYTGVAGMSYGSFANEINQAQLAGDAARVSALRASQNELAQEMGRNAPRMQNLRDVQGVGDAVDFVAAGLPQVGTSMAPVLGAAAAARFGLGGLAKTAGALRSELVPAAQFIERAAPTGAAFGAGATLERNDALGAMQGDNPNGDPVRQRELANLYGAGAGALEAIVPAGAVGALGKKFAGSFLGKAATEGVTEGAQALTQQNIRSAATENRDTSGDIDELINSVALGTLAGSAVHAPHIASDVIDSDLVQSGLKKAGDKIKETGILDKVSQSIDSARNSLKDVDIVEQGREAFRGLNPEQILQKMEEMNQDRPKTAARMRDDLLADPELGDASRATIEAADPNTVQGQASIIGLKQGRAAGQMIRGAVEKLGELASKAKSKPSFAEAAPGMEQVLFENLRPEFQNNNDVLESLPKMSEGLLSLFGRYKELEPSDVEAMSNIVKAEQLFGEGGLENVVQQMNDRAAISVFGDESGDFKRLASIVPATQALRDPNSVVNKLAADGKASGAATMIDDLNARFGAQGKPVPAPRVQVLAKTFFDGNEQRARLALNAYMQDQQAAMKSVMGEWADSSGADLDAKIAAVGSELEDMPDYDGMAQGLRVDPDTGATYELRNARGMPFFTGDQVNLDRAQSKMNAVAQRGYADAATSFKPYGEYMAQQRGAKFDPQSTLRNLRSNLERELRAEDRPDKSPELAARRAERIESLKAQLSAIDNATDPMQALNQFSAGVIEGRSADDSVLTNEDIAGYTELARKPEQSRTPAEQGTMFKMKAPDGSIKEFSTASMVARQGLREGSGRGEAEGERSQRLFREALTNLIAAGYKPASSLKGVSVDTKGTKIQFSQIDRDAVARDVRIMDLGREITRLTNGGGTRDEIDELRTERQALIRKATENGNDFFGTFDPREREQEMGEDGNQELTPSQQADAEFADKSRHAPEASGAGRAKTNVIKEDRPKTVEVSPIVRRVDEIVASEQFHTVDTVAKARKFLETAKQRYDELRDMGEEQRELRLLEDQYGAYQRLFDKDADLDVFFSEAKDYDSMSKEQRTAAKKWAGSIVGALSTADAKRSNSYQAALIRDDVSDGMLAAKMSEREQAALEKILTTEAGQKRVASDIAGTYSLLGLQKLLDGIVYLPANKITDDLIVAAAERISTLQEGMRASADAAENNADRSRQLVDNAYKAEWDTYKAMSHEVAAPLAAKQLSRKFSESLSPRQTQMLKTLSGSAILKGVKFTLVDAHDVGPHYDSQTRTISLPASMGNPKLDAYLYGMHPVDVFIHEAVHAATMVAEVADNAARRDLDKLVAHVREKLPKDSGTTYGFQNAQEFLAEAFSNAGFQNMLREVPALGTSTFTNAWEQFKSWVAKLLGFDGDATALEEALTIGMHLVETTAFIREAGTEGDHISQIGSEVSRLFQKPGYSDAKQGRAKRKDLKQTAKDLAAELGRIRGKDIALVFQRTMGQMGGQAGTWTLDEQTGARTVEVAINSLNPLTVLYHESMHDFFETLSTDQGSRDLRQQLLDVTASAPVRNQLVQLLNRLPADKAKAALASIENDPSEAVAYAFQFWSEGALRITANQKNIFQQIADLIRNVLGVVSQEQKIEKVFEALMDGRLTEPSNVSLVLQELGLETSGEKFERIAGPIAEGTQKLLYSSVDRLRTKNIPALRELADMFIPEEGKGSGGLQFMQRRAQAAGRWSNRFYEAIEGASKTELRAALENLQAMKTPKAGLETKIRAMLDDMHAYMDEAGVALWDQDDKDFTQAVGYQQNYFPRVWNPDAIRNNMEGWIRAMDIAGYDARTAHSVAKGLTGTYVPELADTESSIGYTPFFGSANGRTLSKIDAMNAQEFVEFQDKDLVNIMTTYIYQAVHRAEYARDFGNDGAVIENLLEQAQQQGATAKDIVDAKNAVAAMQGTLGHDFSPALRKFMAGVMTAQNVILLPFALFSSLIDPLGIAVRTGEMGEAWEAFKSGMKGVITDFGNSTDDRIELAKTLGIIDANNMLDSMGNVYNGVYMSPFLKKVNNTYFKLNGMEAWNKHMRVAAMSAGQRFIVKNVDNQAYMDELGLRKTDVKLDAQGNLLVTEADGLSAAQAGRVQDALFKFVDSAILRPNAAHRPIWGSDPRFQLIFHLKQFTYSFHNVILKRVRNDLARGNATPLWVLASYVPFMIASDWLRGSLTGTTHAASTLTDVLANGTERSGILGVGGFGVDAVQDIHKGNLPGTTFLGPSFEHAWMATRTALGAPGTDVQDLLWRSTPAEKLVQSVVQ